MNTHRYIIKCCLCFILGTAAFSAAAQQKSLVPYRPTAGEMENIYQEADKLDANVRKVAANGDIVPNWNPDGFSFSYRKNLDASHWEFIYVDTHSGIRKQAFDNQKLAAAIAKATGNVQDATQLKFNTLFFTGSGKVMVAKIDQKWLEVDLGNYAVKRASDTTALKYDPKAPLQRRNSKWQGNRVVMQSPDGKKRLAVKGGNVYITDLESTKESQLTFDGSATHYYDELNWSPDSKNVIAYLVSPEKTAQVHYVLSSVPGTTRGQLKSREYAQPGDAFTSYEPFIINVSSGKKIKVESEKIDFFRPQRLHWRKNDSRYYTYEKADRGHQRFRVIEVDVLTGKTRNIIEEKTNTFIYESRTYTYYLPKSDEMLWTSEQSGYRHVYLVNTVTGKQQQITKGNWVLRDIDSVDYTKREIWFSASGMNVAEDPYFVHYYRIGFDGKHLVSLSPEQGNHKVTFSPDRLCYLDTYAQPNLAPLTVVKKTKDGKIISELERSTTDAFTATGVQLPEVFVAKARDGKTDIWGLIWRPSKMDLQKSYPVIEYIYAGPQDSFVPKNFTPYCEMQSLAELGFIVVQMDGMGTANRSKAFHDVCWKNLADAGFPDRILWIKAMAAKYPNADISRVGIYGTSAGGQNSTGALLFHPEFYKAAVSSCGCHDNRIDKQWWNEQWMGYPVGPHYDAQSNITNASKLQGNLLLIVGEADENVPPESTFRLADALIKANKDFDFLCVPNMGHSDGGTYGRRRRRDFFVKHLLQVEPPNRNSGLAK